MKARPIFLNLWRIKFPLPAVVSILHRISGLVIFLGLPLLLYLLSLSLISQPSFDRLIRILADPGMKLLVWIVISALAGHFFAGIRHLLMDMGWGETLRSGRVSAYLVMIITVIVILLMGFWIWS